MSAEVTVLQIVPSTSTTIVINQDATSITTSNASATVINAATAVANMPVYVNLSNDIPQQLSNNGSAGTSVLASRADHSHPLIGATFNGGNF